MHWPLRRRNYGMRRGVKKVYLHMETMSLATAAAIIQMCWLSSDRLEDLLRWHQSTVQSVHSVACDVEITWDYPEQPERNQVRKGRFRRQGDQAMVTELEPGETVFHLIRDGKCLQLSRSPDRVGLSLSAPDHRRIIFNVDTWVGVQVNYPITKWYYPFPELVRQGQRPRLVKTKGDLITLRVDCPSRVVKDSMLYSEVTLDKQRGCWVVQIVDGGADNQGKRDFRIKDFQEFSDGVQFPTTVEGRLDTAGKTYLNVTMKLVDLRVNEPIPASEFAVDIPHGAWMSDNIRKTKYQVDSRGQRISVEKPFEGGGIASFSPVPAAPNAEVRGPRTQSDSDAPRVWPYLWSASGGAMVVLLVLWLLQRWRS
ncbi:MAG TPA: hypothetical protein PKC45_18980 [Gemmatales bacterium]|nr:hypothetical protein [Gemmatales bacterium]